MDKKIKHSLIGYDPSAVEDKINSMNLEYEKLLAVLEAELDSVKGENSGLKDRLQAVKHEIDVQERFEKEISRSLFQAHMDAAVSILNALKESEQAEKAKQEKVLAQEKESIRLKKNLSSLIDEMKAAVEGFKHKLDDKDYLKDGAAHEEKAPGPQQETGG